MGAQGRIAGLLWQGLPKGEVITKCSVQTSEGVKVADVAWASVGFLEISEKLDLYLAKGAKEVWAVYLDNRLEIFSYVGLVEQSIFLGDFKKQVF
ncbi:MAG: hypothetical protein RLZZ215_897 [Pseudomonadota bacterium]|jgi:hypothetical protein